MRRINPRAVAVEACITRHGTLVGPLMTDLTGHPELTPYQGGWCGNDIFPDARVSRSTASARGSSPASSATGWPQEGYRGLLEIDYLVDADSGELYLGELNPRLSGISSMTNVTAGAYADMPLFLFHLLEYMDVDYEIDVDEINERWSSQAATDVWSQLVLKEPDDQVELLTAGAQDRASGASTTAAGISFSRWGNDWHSLQDDDRGVLPARARPRRLPLQGRRPRHPGHARAPSDRGQRAHPALPGLDRRRPRAVRRHAGRRDRRPAADARRARLQAGLT